MFDTLTPDNRTELARVLRTASLDTLAEVASAVKLGRVQFDALYGYGRAEQYVRMAHEQAITLADLASAAPYQAA